VLDPVKLVIENYPEGKEETCEAPNHPHKPEWGSRALPFSRELWIEREDFAETPPKGYFRLFPGNKVRLRYGYVVECIGYDKATDTVRCRYDPDTRSGTPGAEKVKVRATFTGSPQGTRIARRCGSTTGCFRVPHPGSGTAISSRPQPDSKKVVAAQMEPALREAKAEERFQFERHGYFVADLRTPAAFNRAVSLRDSWSAPKQPA